MPCPHCASPTTTEQATRTKRGYRTLRCHSCKRACNERTGTPCNERTFPTDIVLQLVLWRLRSKRSVRDLARDVSRPRLQRHA